MPCSLFNSVVNILVLVFAGLIYATVVVTVNYLFYLLRVLYLSPLLRFVCSGLSAYLTNVLVSLYKFVHFIKKVNIKIKVKLQLCGFKGLLSWLSWANKIKLVETCTKTCTYSVRKRWQKCHFWRMIPFNLAILEKTLSAARMDGGGIIYFLKNILQAFGRLSCDQKRH